MRHHPVVGVLVSADWSYRMRSGPVRRQNAAYVCREGNVDSASSAAVSGPSFWLRRRFTTIVTRTRLRPRQSAAFILQGPDCVNERSADALRGTRVFPTKTPNHSRNESNEASKRHPGSELLVRHEPCW